MYGYDYYDYGYDYATTQAATSIAGAAIGFLIFIWLIVLAISVFSIICTWKVFKKANKPGWAAIIPVYNFVVLLEITELPMWYIALLFVPGANIYALIKTYIELAKKFGKSEGFGVGLALLNPIFMAILAFNKSCIFVGANVSAPQQPMAQPVAPVQTVQPQPMVQPVQTVQPQPVQTVQPQPTVCPGCGSPVAENTKFCTHCGRQL